MEPNLTQVPGCCHQSYCWCCVLSVVVSSIHQPSAAFLNLNLSAKEETEHR